MPGIKERTMSEVLIGQSDLVMFGEVADYKTATFDSITASGSSVGQVSGDSSEWAGEEATLENWVDEQGNNISSTPKAGTSAVKFSMADLSNDKISLFLKGTVYEGLTSKSIEEIKSVVGFGVKLPVITRPLGWFNDENNRCLFFPKAKIVSNLSYSDGHFTIDATAVAEYINIKGQLQTAMIINGKAKYEDAAGE